MILSGINHLAFITRDMEMTIRFYRDLLEPDARPDHLLAGLPRSCGDAPGEPEFVQVDLHDRWF